MIDPAPLNRDQIAAFVGRDPAAIRAIERLFTVAGELTPAQIEALQAAVSEALVAGLSGVAAASARDNFAALDYLDFRRVGPHVSQALRMQWNEDDGTVDVGLNADVVLQIGQETHYYAKNTSGAAIADGAAVMFTGTVGASGKLTFGLAVADGSQPAQYMMGVATETIPNNGFGYITSFGLIRGLNTTGATKTVPETWADGDVLYFDPAYPGELTKTQPVAPSLCLPVCVVVNAGVGSGSLFVRMKTGEYLGELHDVDATGAADGDVLTYAGGVWSPAAGGGGGGDILLGWFA